MQIFVSTGNFFIFTILINVFLEGQKILVGRQWRIFHGGGGLKGRAKGAKSLPPHWLIYVYILDKTEF